MSCSNILAPGELKVIRRPTSILRHDLTWGNVATPDTRRFVLGFTICGSFIRIWVFGRLEGVVSERFDTNTDVLQFVSTIFGFLYNIYERGAMWTWPYDHHQQRLAIHRDRAARKRIVNALGALLIVKDSWQYKERNEGNQRTRGCQYRTISLSYDGLNPCRLRHQNGEQSSARTIGGTISRMIGALD
ncbi:uncharacterized protein N7479_001605 [Penicillium vulpinum]|uniref:uncharacterized protein n=1 Tax=Penicillium vulpinum TaxID=29845 RepID=UPI0025482517|nr:uncharacterized protein N7479_001605 [Penicillium vulpinum]KAJ5971687.1 hypothetical protein N7479_001605 [Penicillium vulpinum]